jgi:hypothetical protein
LRLPARTLYWCRLNYSSACLIRIFCIIDGHKGMWVFPHALFYSAHPNIFVRISVLQKNTEWGLHHNEESHSRRLK